MSHAAKILIVDDELILRESLAAWLERDGYQIVAVESGEKGLEQIQQIQFDIMFLDIKLGGMDGLEVLNEVKRIDPELPVIMITAYGSITTAVEAMKKGAKDYLLKPFEPDELSLLIEKTIQQKALDLENLYLRETIKEKTRFDNLIGQSKPMQAIFNLIKKVAPMGSTVLITGETGTGKELVARAIHSHSPQRKGPFVALNCGSIPEQLMESELFGYEKGAFTDAKDRHKGKLELAMHGSLFLDEIGEISQRMQINLLRVLQDKMFYRIGGNKPIQTNCRIIAATNRNLQQSITEGRFRDDLFYRLNVISLKIPPLRERKEDIPLLAKHFLQKFSQETNKRIERISREALDALMLYDWPGNVRELENAIERAVVINQNKTIQVTDLPILSQAITSGLGDRLSPFRSSSHSEARLIPLREAEKEHIINVLNATNWNISSSAKILGIDRSTLYNKLRRYQIKRSNGIG